MLGLEGHKALDIAVSKPFVFEVVQNRLAVGATTISRAQPHAGPEFSTFEALKSRQCSLK